MAITIIFAPPRAGKTLLMTKLLTDEAFNNERIKNCLDELNKLNSGGFNLTYPGYITACNFWLESHKYGYSPRTAKRINPYRLGFLNDNVTTHFIPPYCIVGIMEGQKYFNSRMFSKFPDWQSRFFEMHGHNYYDFLIDTQRPNLIDVNIRELSDFIDIQNMEIKRNEIIWEVNRISSSFELEKYFESGKRNYFTSDKIKGDIRLLNYYNTREAKPLFYNGKYEKDFDRLKAYNYGLNVSDFKKYCELYGRELPENFYEKR